MLHGCTSGRRSSCSSHAPTPIRHRSCPHPHSEFPLAQAPSHDEYHRCSTNSRRRSGCRPASRCGTIRRSSCSTTPAGIISQIARGLDSLLTKSSSEDDPVTPSPSPGPPQPVADLSKTTHSWPFFANRRTMLAPILPRPTIPSCMIASLSIVAGSLNIEGGRSFVTP